MLWGGRNTANNYHWRVLAVIWSHWVCPHSWHVCFPSLHCSGSRCSAGELSKVGPGLCALIRSKPLRFRYSTKSQTRLALRFVPFPGLRRRWHPTPVFLPGKSHGWRNLVGCSSWGREESDTTERLPFHFHALEKEIATHSSVLAWRIPGTGEPWWAAIYGVAQNRTQLK